MPHIVTPTILLDTPKNALVHVYIESDGLSPDLSNYVVLDAKTDFYDSPLNKIKMSVMQVWFSFAWFDGMLAFGNLQETPSWTLARDGVCYHDFRYFGGIKDQSGVDLTSQVLLSTNGLTPLGSKGTMVLDIRKNKSANQGSAQYNTPLQVATPN